jgi:hypothetical protein
MNRNAKGVDGKNGVKPIPHPFGREAWAMRQGFSNSAHHYVIT